MDVCCWLFCSSFIKNPGLSSYWLQSAASVLSERFPPLLTFFVSKPVMDMATFFFCFSVAMVSNGSVDSWRIKHTVPRGDVRGSREKSLKRLDVKATPWLSSLLTALWRAEVRPPSPSKLSFTLGWTSDCRMSQSHRLQKNRLLQLRAPPQWFPTRGYFC